MKQRILGVSLFGAVLLVAAGLRLVHLDNRPMHCDEAVQALKFGQLLEKGFYRYDPREFHGPTLNYTTLPVAWLCGSRSLRDSTESQLRSVPAVFGLLLVTMPFALRRELGTAACLVAALLTAVSPAMVFYSRYYIQETLLVLFTFAAIVALWRLTAACRPVAGGAQLHCAAQIASQTRLTASSPGQAGSHSLDPQSQRLKPWAWLAAIGAFLGLMHASKETCLIALVSMAAAGAVTMPGLRKLGIRRLIAGGMVVLVVAAVVSALLITGFGQNMRGVVDSYTTYLTYFRRAGGVGSEGPHINPPWQYLQWLFAWRGPHGTVCSEGLIAVLAVVGLAAALFRLGLDHAQVAAARFFAVYSGLMTLAYALIPYKTPWCAMGFLHGLILLGGLGAAGLIGRLTGTVGRTTAVVVLLVAAAQLAWQSHRASFVYPADPGNPYVYAHTSPEVLELVTQVRWIAARSGLGEDLYVQVICADDDYWPLPWYLRGYKHVGWYSRPPDAPPAPLVITQPALEEAVAEYVYTWPKPGERLQYLPVEAEGRRPGWELRPNVPLLMYLRRDLWELCQ